MNKPQENELVEMAATPQTMNLIQLATEKGADLTTMQGYFELHKEWEANEARKAFAASMCAFQSECPPIQKTRKGHNGNYAGLAEAIAQIKELESKHGLSHTWKSTQTDGAVSVTCFVTHVMGHKEHSSLTAAPDTSGSKNSIQAIGSTKTYLERYTLFSVLGLSSTDEDDDGAGAFGTISPEQVKALRDRLDATGSDIAVFCKHMKVDSIVDIPAKMFGKADNAIRAKEKKNVNT
jgi:hypothetical protein